MLADQFAEWVAAARCTSALDDLARLLWKANAESEIDDDAAQALGEAVQARRTAFALPGRAKPLSRIIAACAPRRPPRPRSRNRAASIERRRRQAMSGIIPARIAAGFTMGEIAALSVIAREVQAAKQCVLPVDKIAALAGVSRTTTQNAVRTAVSRGLILRTERRRRGLPSLTNIVEIVSAEWTTWLRLGREVKTGLNKLSPTSHNLYIEEKKRSPGWLFGATWREAKRKRAVKGDGSALNEDSCERKWQT